MKSIVYAYPTSDDATKHGFKNEGCFIVTVGTVENAYREGSTAVHHFFQSDEPIDPWSFFGQYDTATMSDRLTRLCGRYYHVRKRSYVVKQIRFYSVESKAFSVDAEGKSGWAHHGQLSNTPKPQPVSQRQGC